MLREVLHCKIHMATVTRARPDYVGSITIDEDLLRASGLRVNDKVLVANCNNGARFETYVFRGAPGEGAIEVNGAAANLVEEGDKVIVLHYALMDDAEYENHHPMVVIPDEANNVGQTMQYHPGP